MQANLDGADSKSIHWAGTTLPAIRLLGMTVLQKGRRFFLIKARPEDLDRLCQVPSIPFDRENREIAEWVLSQAANKWQRGLDQSRVLAISDFFGKPNNFLVNSAVISVPLNQNWIAEIDEKVVITVPVTWYVDHCPNPECGYLPAEDHEGEKFDACPNCDWDGRPGTIIDGQHRIRGSARSQNAADTIITTLLTEESFSTADMAKIFTEITTTAVDLHDLHKVYLLYKFKLTGRRIGKLSDADFSIDPPTPPNRNTRGLRNRRAYEIVCKLCMLTNSHWHNRITILPEASGRQRRGDVIEADEFLSYIEKWLEEGVFTDPAQPDGMIDIDQAVAWSQAYLDAIIATWPVGGGNAEPYWSSDRQNVGVLQQRGIVEVLIRLFPTVTKRILDRSSHPDLPNYKSEFAYIEPIDWTDPAWSGLSSPDKNKEMLLRILIHVFESAPSPVHNNRIGNWINNWIKAAPDPPHTFIQRPSGGNPMRNASRTNPLIFKWEAKSPFTGSAINQPLNAYTTADVYLTQLQAGRIVVLAHIETTKNSLEVTEPPHDLDTSSHALPVAIEVVYSNPNEVARAQTQHPP